MSVNGCGPGETSGAHAITLGMVQPHLWDTSPPPVGFARVVPRHPNASLGWCGCLAAARDFNFPFILLLLCVCACVLQQVDDGSGILNSDCFITSVEPCKVTQQYRVTQLNHSTIF